MNPSELLRMVDTIHRDKSIDKEVLFQAIEAALISATKKNFNGEDVQIYVHIDRSTGEVEANCNGEPISPEEIARRISAQTAKQVMIQKIREAECEQVYDEFYSQINQLVVGTVHRFEKEGCTVTLSGIEAFLPRTEQIHVGGGKGGSKGDSYRNGDRIRAVIAEVRKQGSRVKVVLSRVRPVFVSRLFEQEIPEIGDGVIEIKSIARRAGVRSKIAVWSADQRVDCVGACVGMRGARIKNIVDELDGERIDIVPWSSDPIEFISNALKPAEIEEVILCEMLGRAIVLVTEENLSLAIGRYGQNVYLASKLVGWDIEILTPEELQTQLDQAVAALCTIPGVSQELAESLTGEGFTTYDDLSIIEPDDLMEMSGLSEEEVNAIIEEAERRADEQDNQQNLVRDEQID